MCRPTEALLYWKLASSLNALRRLEEPLFGVFGDVVDARDDIEGLSVCADHWRIRQRCLDLLSSKDSTVSAARFEAPTMYEWPEQLDGFLA